MFRRTRCNPGVGSYAPEFEELFNGTTKNSGCWSPRRSMFVASRVKVSGRDVQTGVWPPNRSMIFFPNDGLSGQRASARLFTAIL